jgi:pSer/pThr/pTyr-binding forkhead associated (FHA) protein
LPIPIFRQSRRARLVVKRSGIEANQEFNITERAVVGRPGTSAGRVDVDLAALPEAAYISARHAEIRYEVGVGWVIRDLGSQNGSFLRHPGTTAFHRVVGEEALRDGDEVSFGNARFVFQLG